MELFIMKQSPLTVCSFIITPWYVFLVALLLCFVAF